MAERKLNVTIADTARVYYSALGPKDRRKVDGWLERLRDWHSDPFGRENSQRLKDDEELYALRPPRGQIIPVFRLSRTDVTVITFLEAEGIRAFQAAQERVTG